MLDMTPTITGDAWDTMGTWRYGIDPVLPHGGPHSPVPHLTSSSATPLAKAWSPDHPLFWFAAVLVLTGLGMFGISGSVKVGKTKVSGSVGSG